MGVDDLHVPAQLLQGLWMEFLRFFLLGDILDGTFQLSRLQHGMLFVLSAL